MSVHKPPTCLAIWSRSLRTVVQVGHRWRAGDNGEVQENSVKRCPIEPFIYVVHFVEKSLIDVRKLITGPQVHICDECVALCNEILAQDGGMEATEKEERRKLRPKDIKEYLDEHIIGQSPAKKAISVAVYNHYKRINAESSDDDAQLFKGNILMAGPTGCGKTAIAQALAKLLDVPFVVTDGTSLTEAGYVGEDVESIIKSLWIAADRDVERASRGIIVIDEIDKIARRGDSGASTRDVGGEGVQQALLKMIESDTVTIYPDGARTRPHKELIRSIRRTFCSFFAGLLSVWKKSLSSGCLLGRSALAVSRRGRLTPTATTTN